MKKELLVALCGVVFLVMMIVALFNNRGVQTTAQEALHEVKTADLWQTAYAPAALPCPVGSQTYYSPYQGGYQMPQNPNQPVAMQPIAVNGAQPIYAGQEKPVLIKQFGVETVPISGGKVKITGVMGNSWADKAGLKAGDILLAFNTKEITDFKQFQIDVAKAPPEKPYKVIFLRNGRKMKCQVTVGEGEMEGFLPIKQMQ
jgi:membrane-associated protease RseP (regulator of RpoE activity)